MTFMKSALAKGALITTLAAGALVAGGTAATADVACNHMGECWHVHDRLTYPAELGVVFHDDTWAAAHRHHYHWRHDRFDHGYYRNGVWITF